MIKKVFIGICSLLLVSACASGPQNAAKNFSENLAKGKIEEAKKYATEPTGKLLDMASQMGSLPIDPDYKFIFIKDSVVNNKAWVTASDPKTGREEIYELVKIDGKWLVHLQSKK